MVSRIAVIALVAIVACPILIGYGMNLQETTYTEYALTNNAINVTDLLKNGDSYTLANADVYQINTNFTDSNGNSVVPLYQRQAPGSSTLKYSTNHVSWTGGGWDLTDSTYFLFNYKISQGSVSVVIKDADYNTVATVNNCTLIYYDKPTDSITYAYYDAILEIVNEGHISGGNYKHYQITPSGFSVMDVYWGVAGGGNVNFAGGFCLGNVQSYPQIELPTYTRSYTMTINLDSITAANYTLTLRDAYGQFNLYKTTVDGVVTWKCSGNGGDQVIYYDSSHSNNTYQLSKQFVERYEINNRLYIKTHAEFSYVGSWPTLIGKAPAYLTYEFDQTTSQPVNINGWDNTDFGFQRVRPEYDVEYGIPSYTPIIRMDEAKFQAFQYPIIQNTTYDPAAFRENPSTKITDVGKYGSYITFGGVRYDVNDGNITLGTHELPVKDLVFNSVPAVGGYANNIGNTTISVTGTPSTIVLGGEWGANVITDSMAETTYTKTEWTPGQFGWDGIDQNFLMVGLLTSLGVFIALGIYIRRTKANLWPLLIVCGGAAMLFFCML